MILSVCHCYISWQYVSFFLSRRLIWVRWKARELTRWLGQYRNARIYSGASLSTEWNEMSGDSSFFFFFNGNVRVTSAHLSACLRKFPRADYTYIGKREWVNEYAHVWGRIVRWIYVRRARVHVKCTDVPNVYSMPHWNLKSLLNRVDQPWAVRPVSIFSNLQLNAHRWRAPLT